MKHQGRKIKMAYFLLIVIPLITIAYFFIWDNVNQRKQAEINKNVMMARYAALMIQHKVEHRLTQIANISNHRDIREMDLKHITDTLQTYDYDPDEQFFVADINGKVVGYTHSKTAPGPMVLKKDGYFKQALGGRTLVTGQIKSPFSGNYAIWIYAPVRDKSNKITGVIGDELTIPFFKEYLEPVKIGETGRLSLIDSEGNYIYDRLAANQKKLNPALCFWDNPGKDLSVIERTSKNTGRKTIYTKVRVPGFNWYIVASQRSSEIVAPGLNTLTKNLITLMLLITTLIVLWRYKSSLEYQQNLIKRQNADKMALIGELAAGMAHEIRNPLTAIKGFTDLLKEKMAPGDNEPLEVIGQSVDHIEGIVRETLLLAKPQKMSIVRADVCQLVLETCTFMKNEALLRDINLQCIRPDEHLFVNGDVLHLKQVLVNIIKNAIEATPGGGTVSIKAERTKDGMVRLSIRDTGIGINAACMDKVGNPFFTTKPDGTGLGLSVCKRIIDEHGGTLEIKSTEGAGTTVTVNLPLL